MDAVQKVARQDYLEERYSELDTIESGIRRIIEDIEDKNYKEPLMEIMYQAQDEKEETEAELQQFYDEEEKEREREYWDTQGIL